MQNKETFLKVITELEKNNVLSQIMLIGSWCQFFYQHYFNEHDQIPAVRTLDLDFLIPNPPNVRKEIDVSSILTNMGFSIDQQARTGLIKFSHPDLMVEFLIPELGRGKQDAYEIPKLHINAVGLRYLNLLQAHPMKMKYENMSITLPELAAYALHKHIVSERRLKEDKKEKDKLSAISIGTYLLAIPAQKKKLSKIFKGMPKSWQKQILTITKRDHLEMAEFLKT